MRHIQSPSGFIFHDSNNMAVQRDPAAARAAEARAVAAGSSGRKRQYNESKDVLKHMMKLEDTTYRQPLPSIDNDASSASSSSDHHHGSLSSSCSSSLSSLSSSSPFPSSSSASPSTRAYLPSPFHGLWRQQIIEWMYTLVKYCKLRHEAAAAATYYLDQGVCRGLITTPTDYQLAAMTSLYLALKIYDSPSMRIVKLSSLVKLGNGDFYEHDIVRMERDLVRVLEWRLNPVTTNCFLQQFLKVFSDCLSMHGMSASSLDLEMVEEVAQLAIEYAVAREAFLSIKRSTIAYAALLSAISEVTTTSSLSSSPSSPKILQNLMTSLHQRMVDVAGLDSAGANVVNAITMLERARCKGNSNKRTMKGNTSDEGASTTTTTGQTRSPVSLLDHLENETAARPNRTTHQELQVFTTSRISCSSLTTMNQSTSAPTVAIKMDDGLDEEDDPDVAQFLEASFSPNFVLMH